MRGFVRLAWFALAAAALTGPPGAWGQGGGPTKVEPGDLTRRPDLVGREVVVEDRLSRFQYHNETRTFDEIYLRRAPDLPFKLPPELRTRQAPTPPARGQAVRMCRQAQWRR